MHRSLLFAKKNRSRFVSGLPSPAVCSLPVKVADKLNDGVVYGELEIELQWPRAKNFDELNACPKRVSLIGFPRAEKRPRSPKSPRPLVV